MFARAGFVTACSDDLARRAVALGAAADRLEVVPYGVDAARFKPDAGRARGAARAPRHRARTRRCVVAAGRLVRKKGFEYLIDAMPRDCPAPAHLAIAGGGDLAEELRARARAAGVADRVHFLGDLAQDEVGALVRRGRRRRVPSVRDDSGNVDGLPNTVLEALASGTPLVSDAGRRHRQRSSSDEPDRRDRRASATPAALAAAIARAARAIRRGARGSAPAGRALVDGAFRLGRARPRDSRRPTIARLPSSHSPAKI